MFAEKRGREAVANGRIRQMNRISDAFHHAQHRVFQLHDKSTGLRLHIFECFRDGVDGRSGNFRFREPCQPFAGRFLLECILQHGD